MFVPPNMSYSKPEFPLSSQMDYVSFGPVSGSSFGPDSNIKINVQSNSGFLDPRRSYLKYDLKMTGGGTTAGNVLSVLGGVSVIKTFTTNVSGLECERIEDYNEYCSILYKRSPETYKNTIKELEAFNNQTRLHLSPNVYTYGRSIIHAPRIAVLEGTQGKAIPLPFIRGGIEFSITLDTLNNVLAANTQADTSYVVSNVQFVGAIITPTQEYMASYSASLSRGSEAQMPLTLVKRHSFVPTNTTNQTTQIHIGYLKSLRSVIGTCRLNSSRNSSSVDAFNNDTSNKLKEYRWSIGDKHYPKNYKFKCINDPTASSPVSPENIIQMMNSVDNTFVSLNSTTHSSNTDFAVFYNWASEGFASGVSVVDGIVSFEQDYTSAPDASVFDLFFVYDSILSISALDVKLDVRDF